MADYEVRTERVVERPVTGRRIIEERRGGGWGYGFNPFAGVIMAIVIVLLVLLLLGVLV